MDKGNVYFRKISQLTITSIVRDNFEYEWISSSHVSRSIFCQCYIMCHQAIMEIVA